LTPGIVFNQTNQTFLPSINYIGTGITFVNKTLTFDANNNSDAQFFITDIGSGMDFTSVIFVLLGGAKACNIFWLSNPTSGSGGFTITTPATNVPGIIITTSNGSTSSSTFTITSQNIVGHVYSNTSVTFTSTGNVSLNSDTCPLPPITCFKEGTKILTNKGYKPIEELRKGDLVKTLNHDYKPIYMIGKSDIYHVALQERIKDQLYKCSQKDYHELFEPLIISGSHSILVDDFVNIEQKTKVIELNGKIFITDNKYRVPACTDIRSSVYETPGTYTIYHLSLDNDNYYHNYGIYANGLLVETCSKRYLKELSKMTLIE
jgi:hypothetical protein